MATTTEPIFYTAPGNTPSVKRIAENLGLPIGTAKTIKSILTGKADLMQFESARHRQDEAYHNHEPITLAFEALNSLTDGCGVGYIASHQDGFSRGEHRGIGYVNQGYPYTNTIYFDHNSEACRIGCWVTEVELRPNFYC